MPEGYLTFAMILAQNFFFLCSYQATAKKRHSHLNARLSDNLKAEFTLALFYISRVWKSRNLREKKKKVNHRIAGSVTMALRERSRIRFQAAAV